MLDELIRRRREEAAEALAQADAIRERYGQNAEWSAEDEQAFDRMMEQFRRAHEEAERLAARQAQANELDRYSDIYFRPNSSTPHRGSGEQPDERQQRLAAQHEAMLRYIRRGENALSPEERNALISSQGDLGGFTVPEDFVPELLKDLRGFSVIRQRARVRTTTRDALVFPAFASGDDPEPTDYDTDDEWVTEADLVTAVTDRSFQDRPTFERLRVPVHIWAPKPVVLSHTLVSDNAVNLEAELRQIIAETRALREDRAFILGDGNNKPKGIIREVEQGNIETEVTGSASALTYDGLVNLWSSLPAQYRQNATWLMNSRTFGEILKLKDSQNRPLVDVNTVPLNLWTRPIAFSEYMPDVAASSCPIIFGDFSWYGIVDREDMMLIRLGELYAPSVALLPVARVGGQVLRTKAFRAQVVGTT